MKFAKVYIDHIQERQPGWRDKFLSYNELKRLLRLIPDDGNAESQFLCLLNNEIDKFNVFFTEEEEDFIIHHMELQQNMKKAIDLWGANGSQPSEANYKETMNRLIKDIVDLHGAMVLFINYCNINYTGLTKILKKYDRKTGGLQHLPFLQKVLEHPFLTTNVISQLVRECENKIDEVSQAGEAAERANLEVVLDEGLFRNTHEALVRSQEDPMVVEEGEGSEPNPGVSILNTPIAN